MHEIKYSRSLISYSFHLTNNGMVFIWRNIRYTLCRTFLGYVIPWVANLTEENSRVFNEVCHITLPGNIVPRFHSLIPTFKKPIFICINDLYIQSPIRLHGVVLNYLSTGTTLPLNDDADSGVPWTMFSTVSTYSNIHLVYYCTALSAIQLPNRVVRTCSVRISAR
jgi:hypothetical protein